jgi:ATP-dependent DNA helicase DinG
MNISPSEILSADGPLVRQVENFTPRSQQQAMADRVGEAIENYETLVCEAGTGTGKTFAYLVPALLSGKKVIISTGTKNLQDQLFHKDLPVVRKALGLPVSVALLKGRANYLCLHRLDQNRDGGRLRSPKVLSDLSAIQSWAGRTRSGDIAELSEVAETSPVWPLATSTAENCLGQECAFFKECFVVKARREAAASDVLVVNHHLFLADMALREEGFGEVLPGAEAVIFDEAHQLPEAAAQFFGLAVSSRQLVELSRDTLKAWAAEARDMGELRERAEQMETAIRRFRLALGGSNGRGNWAERRKDPVVSAMLEALAGSLADLAASLETAAGRGKALENCRDRASALSGRLARFAPDAKAADRNVVRWFETSERGFLLHETPLDVSEPFRARLSAYKSTWVFTSATLAVGEDFGHFKSRLGITEAREARWESPFDFARQALLYLPRLDLDPRDPGYTRQVVETALPVLQASGGRAFLLFTSHRALRETEERLRGRTPFPLLVQGQAPRGELLEEFRRLGNAVLLGAASFWEGVDVRGEALSLVVIDKLPFAAPDDPVTQARIEAMRERGQNPFLDYQLPEAIIALKQGVGRLIRDPQDRGVLMLCDPRLMTKSYGRVFLKALPPLPVTHALRDVQSFFG